MWHDMIVEQIPLAEKAIGTQPGASLSGSNSSTFAGMSISLMHLHVFSKDSQSINSLPSIQHSSSRRLAPRGGSPGRDPAPRFKPANILFGTCEQRRSGQSCSSQSSTKRKDQCGWRSR